MPYIFINGRNRQYIFAVVYSSVKDQIIRVNTVLQHCIVETAGGNCRPSVLIRGIDVNNFHRGREIGKGEIRKPRPGPLKIFQNILDVPGIILIVDIFFVLQLFTG